MFYRLKTFRRLLRTCYKQDTIAAINILYGLVVFASIIIAWESFNGYDSIVFANTNMQTFAIVVCLLVFANALRFCFKQSYTIKFRMVRLLMHTCIDLLCIYAIAIALHLLFIISHSVIVDAIQKFFAE